jgi:inosose dehydratase
VAGGSGARRRGSAHSRHVTMILMHRNLNRRQFVAAAAGTVVLPLAAPAQDQTFRIGFAPDMGSNGSIDAWWRACDECMRLGFHYVEANNGPLRLVETFGGRPKQFREEMAKRKLTLAGLALFTPMVDRNQRRQVIDANMRVARFLQAVGGKYITHLFAAGTNPTVETQKLPRHMTREGFKDFAATANEAGKLMQEILGIRIALHAEKEAVRAGVCDPIMDATDPRYFYFWADVGDLAAGGQDPLAVIRKYRSRLIGTHLKDWDPKLESEFGGQKEKGSFLPPGKGTIDLPAIMAYLKETKFDGYNMVEVRAQATPTKEMADYLVGRLGLRL